MTSPEMRNNETLIKLFKLSSYSTGLISNTLLDSGSPFLIYVSEYLINKMTYFLSFFEDEVRSLFPSSWISENITWSYQQHSDRDKRGLGSEKDGNETISVIDNFFRPNEGDIFFKMSYNYCRWFFNYISENLTQW